jgi:hypothetical protein
MKKPFNETKFGKLIGKAKDIGLDVLPIVTKATSGNIGGAIKDTISILKGEETEQAREILSELELEREKIELDFYRASVEDRDSAREREVEVAKSGKVDWLMYATGFTGLTSFIVIIYAVIWIPSVLENELFIHLMGMIEGVVISNLFAYFFGTSKQ